MPREPLETVLRLRRHAVEEARRALTDSLVGATQAEIEAHQIEREIQTETDRAADITTGDSLVEAFAAWLPSARKRLSAARAAQHRQEADVTRCRAELAASRTAMQSVETLLAERKARQAEAGGRRAQRALDDMGARSGSES